jgi:tRNA (guanine-N7-)-methyltransferase
MGQQKLKRFAEFSVMNNCFDFPFHLKGKWQTQVFKNQNPIILELACGKGEYTVNLSQLDLNTNFIGIDIKSNRMWKGAKIAQAENLQNSAFVRMTVQKLKEVFEKNEVDEIWITFPDPFPKERHEKNRLTHPEFLAVYKQVLKDNGPIHFKTDDDNLFNYTLETLEQLNINPTEIIRNVHHDIHNYDNLRNITTHYEKLFSERGRTIKYCKFYLDNLKISKKSTIIDLKNSNIIA